MLLEHLNAAALKHQSSNKLASTRDGGKRQKRREGTNRWGMERETKEEEEEEEQAQQ